MKELSLDVVQSQLSKKQQLLVDEGTMEQVKLLSENPDYGPEFVDSYLDHLNVLKEDPRGTPTKYMNAIKFYTLVEAGNNLTDAYIKTFPDRYEARKYNHPDAEDGAKDFMRGEASRYNKTKMLADIRKVGAIPVQLIYRHVLHDAITEQANLMYTAKSEIVRQKAGEVLIRELKPDSDTVITVDVNDGAKSAIEELRLAAERLAIAEHNSVKAGVPLKDIAESRVYEGEVIEDDDD